MTFAVTITIHITSFRAFFLVVLDELFCDFRERERVGRHTVVELCRSGEEVLIRGPVDIIEAETYEVTFLGGGDDFDFAEDALDGREVFRGACALGDDVEGDE